MNRILIVNTSYPPVTLGGAELSVQELATGLSDLGNVVRVACLAPRDFASQDDDRVGAPSVRRLRTRVIDPRGKNPRPIKRAIWHLSELARLRQFFFLRGIIREFEPDLIHLNNIAGFGWLAWLAARSVPSVQTVRDFNLVCTSATGDHGGRQCDRTSLRCRLLKSVFLIRKLQPQYVVGVSDYVSVRMGEAGIRGKVGIATVYNLPKLVRKTRARRLQNSRFVFAFLGRLDPDKGLDVVLRAARMLDPNGSRFVVRVGGTGSTESEDHLAVEFAEEFDSGLFEKLGNVEPGTFLAHADALLVPTQWNEPFGRVAAEALISNTAIVHSAVGGLPELIGVFGGRAISVSPHESSGAWAFAMEKALKSDWDFFLDLKDGPPLTSDAYAEIYAQLLGLKSLA